MTPKMSTQKISIQKKNKTRTLTARVNFINCLRTVSFLYLVTSGTLVRLHMYIFHKTLIKITNWSFSTNIFSWIMYYLLSELIHFVWSLKSYFYQFRGYFDKIRICKNTPKCLTIEKMKEKWHIDVRWNYIYRLL